MRWPRQHHGVLCLMPPRRIAPRPSGRSFSYERRAIQSVVDGPDRRSPMTREVLTRGLLPNRALRQRIIDHENEIDRIAEQMAERMRGQMSKADAARSAAEAENAQLRARLAQLEQGSTDHADVTDNGRAQTTEDVSDADGADKGATALLPPLGGQCPAGSGSKREATSPPGELLPASKRSAGPA